MIKRLLHHRDRNTTDLYHTIGIDKLRTALEQFGKIDIPVNDAGTISAPNPLLTPPKRSEK
jgi:hypothetical protein